MIESSTWCPRCGPRGRESGNRRCLNCDCRMIAESVYSELRADERARVEAEVVAWLREQTGDKSANWCAASIEMGEHHK